MVEGIPVAPNAQPVAEDRIDYVEDQIAEESQQVFAEERDGGGHGHGHGHSHNHNAPAAQVVVPAPQQVQQGGDSYSAPSPPQDSYGSPQGEPIQDGYGAPQAPPQTSYNPPPQAKPSGPIPVPLPVPVRPGSIVLPQKPTYNRPPPQQKPVYNRPPPQKKPQYKPPPPKPYRPVQKPPAPRPKPQKRPPPPKYRPKPKPQPKPQPTYNRPRPPPKYKPKPTYAPPKPTYNKQPPKQQYVQKPRPVVKQPPPKQVYAPAPRPQAAKPVPSYVKPSKPDDPWPQAQPDMPKITSLDVQCEKNLMKVSIKFDKPFYGIIFSKGFYSDAKCVHLPAALGRSETQFDVAINSCGTTGNTENGLYGYGADSGSGTYFENTIVVQYDPQVQEVWDQARKLRCTWHDQYEKSVTFRYLKCFCSIIFDTKVQLV